MENVNIERVQVTKEVGEALNLMIEELGREKLFARGFEFLIYASRRQAHSIRPLYKAASTVKDFTRETDRLGQASLYMRMLLVGFEIVETKEEKNQRKIDSVLAILREKQKNTMDYAEHIDRPLPKGYYQIEAAIDILKDIEL